MAGAPRPLLNRGDTVGVVATGFAVRRPLVEAGAARLTRMGYRVRLGRHVFSREGYFAGSDAQRAEDLRTMLEDPEVRAVWFARGGFGTSRILDQVPWKRLAREPKLLIGYSDVTALLCCAAARSGRTCLHGPLVAELGDPRRFHGPSLRTLLAGEALSLSLAPRQVVVGGRARGRLLGGNLSVLAHVAGTRYAPDFSRAILFLEDVGEETYRIDRLLTQLRLSGAFEALAGVLLGGFGVPRTAREFPPDRALDDVLGENFCALGIPVVRGLRAGHVPRSVTLPIGGTVEVDTPARSLRFVP